MAALLPCNRPRAVLVEDDGVARELMREYLSAAGFETCACASVDDACRCVGEVRPAVLVIATRDRCGVDELVAAARADVVVELVDPSQRTTCEPEVQVIPLRRGRDFGLLARILDRCRVPSTRTSALSVIRLMAAEGAGSWEPGHGRGQRS